MIKKFVTVTSRLGKLDLMYLIEKARQRGTADAVTLHADVADIQAVLNLAAGEDMLDDWLDQFGIADVDLALHRVQAHWLAGLDNPDAFDQAADLMIQDLQSLVDWLRTQS